MQKVTQFLTEFKTKLTKLWKQPSSKHNFIPLVVVLLIVMYLMRDILVVTLISVVYAGYQTLKSLDNKEDNAAYWLKYWTVFGVLTLVELILGPLL